MISKYFIIQHTVKIQIQRGLVLAIQNLTAEKKKLYSTGVRGK